MTRRFTVDGETLNMSEWARRCDVSPSTILGRIRAGWPIERAVTTTCSAVGRRARVTRFGAKLSRDGSALLADAFRMVDEIADELAAKGGSESVVERLRERLREIDAMLMQQQHAAASTEAA